MDDAATIEGLETRSMTGSTISSRMGAAHGLMPIQDARVAYTGYRQAAYDQKLPITAHKDHVRVIQKGLSIKNCKNPKFLDCSPLIEL